MRVKAMCILMTWLLSIHGARYSYYSKGARRNVAYLSSILGVTFLFYITIMLVIALFNLDKYIPIGLNESKGTKYLKIALIMSPIFFFLYFGVKEKK